MVVKTLRAGTLDITQLQASTPIIDNKAIVHIKHCLRSGALPQVSHFQLTSYCVPCAIGHIMGKFYDVVHKTQSTSGNRTYYIANLVPGAAFR